MKVLIDTNVILDWIMSRKPFAETATKVMQECLFGNTESYLASHTISDLFYILRKYLNAKQRKDILLLLCDRLKIVPESADIIKKALSNDAWLDLEDGLQMQCAINEKVDFIVTRNIKDFNGSEVKAIHTEEFCRLIASK